MRVTFSIVLLALVGLTNGCSPAPPRVPHAIFLIVVDTLRPDRLSCYGYEAHETPNIDALARQGARFSHAHSVASWTMPSMGAMMTSLYPTQLGLTEAAAPDGQVYEWQELRGQANWTIAQDETTLAELFQDAGYRTAAFVDQPGLINDGAFFQGFDDAFFPLSPTEITRYEPEKLEYPQWAPFLREGFSSDEHLIVRFDEWLAANNEQKLFVWIHLLTPHWPYDPLPDYMPNHEVAETDEHKLEERFYNGEVRAVDDLVGRITAAIEDHVGMDRSLVLLTSDHGEGLGEHGMHDHGHSLHAEVIRVPLIISAPTFLQQRTVDTHVRTIDILPTLLDFVDGAKVTPPAIEGTSLMPLLEGRDQVLPVFSEAMLYGSTERSLIDGDFKVMYDAQEPDVRLFNIALDPRELHDVAGRHPETRDRLRRALATTHDDLVLDRERRTAGKAQRSTDRDERMLDALRSLGYVD